MAAYENQHNSRKQLERTCSRIHGDDTASEPRSGVAGCLTVAEASLFVIVLPFANLCTRRTYTVRVVYSIYLRMGLSVHDVQLYIHIVRPHVCKSSDVMLWSADTKVRYTIAQVGAAPTNNMTTLYMAGNKITFMWSLTERMYVSTALKYMVSNCGTVYKQHWK